MTYPSKDLQILVQLFNDTFLRTHNTELVCCEPEPIYRPAKDARAHHQIIFSHVFFSSALHEIAHWCVAGKQRRLVEDYGYWYTPDGRTDEQQILFEKVEVKPQALEWIFSNACQHTFHFSADNLEGNATASKTFQMDVLEQVHNYLKQGLPQDAQTWMIALLKHYRPTHPLTQQEFELSNTV